MFSRVPRWSGRLMPAATFASLLAVASAALATLSQVGQTRWLEWASTNVANMGTHPVAAMVVSAFLAQGDTTVWVVLALLGIGVTGLAFGACRTVALVACAHVLGTVISEGVLWYQISAGARPVAQERILDVGPSYVVIGALVAGILFGGPSRGITHPAVRLQPAAASVPSAVAVSARPVRQLARHSGRIACAIGFAVVAPDCFNGLAQLDVAAMGHTCAAVTAIGFGWVLRTKSRGPEESGQRRPVTSADLNSWSRPG
jgi:hypothetical protein